MPLVLMLIICYILHFKIKEGSIVYPSDGDPQTFDVKLIDILEKICEGIFF